MAKKYGFNIDFLMFEVTECMYVNHIHCPLKAFIKTYIY